MEALILFAVMVCQPPDVFGGECLVSARVPCGAESFHKIDLDAINVPLKADVPPILVAAAQPPCPNGQCPAPVRRAARAAASTASAPPRVVVQKAKVAAAPKSLVQIHNDLHNGFEGGPNWTWPGDLAEHLRTAHGVNLSATKQEPTPAAPQASACPGGVCPTVQQSRPTRSILRRITRRR